MLLPSIYMLLLINEMFAGTSLDFTTDDSLGVVNIVT